jgi:formylglycine-generating enzyme required for sulfatase activity
MKKSSLFFILAFLLSFTLYIQNAGADNEPKEANVKTDDFVFIKGGTFIMGSPSEEAERGQDETQRRVSVNNFLSCPIRGDSAGIRRPYGK